MSTSPKRVHEVTEDKDHDASVAAAASSKRVRVEHDDDTDANTESEIDEHSTGGSDHGDELNTDWEGEVPDLSDAPDRTVYAAFKFEEDQRSVRVRCTHCKNRYSTDVMETLFKPVDVECENEVDELEGGHVALKCNLIFKRRTFVVCPLCHHADKIPNQMVDDDAGEVLGEALKTCFEGEDNPFVKEITQKMVEVVPRKYVLSSLLQLKGPRAV